MISETSLRNRTTRCRRRCPSRTGRLAPQRSGSTLLELIAASALIATVLVSTLALIRDSMQLGDRAEQHRALTTQCVSLIERQLAAAAVDFSTGTFTGDLAAEGHPELHYTAVRSTAASDGGIANRLMAVLVTVWHDENGNSLLDATEASVVMNTKLAGLKGYQDAASN